MSETDKAHEWRKWLYHKYMSGKGVDIGWRGNGLVDPKPVLPTSIGIETDTPGYDGINLPFPDGSLDYVFSSHMLEHHPRPVEAIAAWHRALKVGGHIITIVPHQHLYEKKLCRPSKWNADHKRFYTPGCLLMEFEVALPPNSYRVRHLRDNDHGFDYTRGPDVHSNGCYEIELVIEKIAEPAWKLS